MWCPLYHPISVGAHVHGCGMRLAGAVCVYFFVDFRGAYINIDNKISLNGCNFLVCGRILMIFSPLCPV